MSSKLRKKKKKNNLNLKHRGDLDLYPIRCLKLECFQSLERQMARRGESRLQSHRGSVIWRSLVAVQANPCEALQDVPNWTQNQVKASIPLAIQFFTFRPLTFLI